MKIDLINNLKNNLNENNSINNFINELSNYLKNPNDNKWNNLLEDDLILNNTKIISKYKDEMIKERAKILQKYAYYTKERGEMYYIYNISSNKENCYNICVCEKNKSNKIITIKKQDLPDNSKLGSVLRKKGNKFVLDEKSTININNKINKMINKKIKEQDEYLNKKRIENHTYQIGEKYLGRIWLFDLNNVVGGAIEGIEEINFPEELYNKVKEGDTVVFKNGKYEQRDRPLI